jgi:hypothetical protein
VERIVTQLRQRWPEVSLVLRADSGFCREELMGWCESNHVDYLFGLARNQRLRRIIGAQMHQAHILHQTSRKPARVFAEFSYQTRKSWSRARRVVARRAAWSQGHECFKRAWHPLRWQIPLRNTLQGISSTSEAHRGSRTEGYVRCSAARHRAGGISQN